MARFAHECSIKFIEVANELELALGYVVSSWIIVSGLSVGKVFSFGLYVLLPPLAMTLCTELKDLG